MKSITINGSKRESVGKKATKALRNAEKVPCVLYGGEKPLHFSAPEIAFKDLIYTPDVHTVKIKLEDGSKVNAVLQDIQFHPVSEAILHLDFYEFHDDQEITMEIPIHHEGTPKGVKNGGVLRFNLRRLRVRGLADKLPDFIMVNVTKLKIGDKFYVTEVEDKDFNVLHPENTVICQIRTPRVLIEDLEEEEEDEAVEGEEGAEVPATEQKDDEEGKPEEKGKSEGNEEKKEK